MAGVGAQNENIGGDLNWPQTPLVTDEPLPQQPAKPKPAGTERQSPAAIQASQPQNEQQQQPPAAAANAGRPATSGTRPSRSSSARQQPREEDSGEARRPRRAAASNSDSRDEEEAPPPLPVRREAAALPQRDVPSALNLAQTVPATERDDDLGKLIGQMLIIGFQGTAPDESWPQRVTAQIESGQIGGVVVMSQNIRDPHQLAKLTAAFRRAKAEVAPFIAIDQEGGPTQLLTPEKGFQHYDSAAELGTSNDPLNAYNLYQRMAIDLGANGFNVNFGPVVDLDPLGENHAAVSNERRYGAQPKHVAAFAKAFRLAHHSEGLLTVLKHFPGPLNETPGTHPGETQGAPRWDPVALEPYRQLVEGGNADMIMVGHLADPEFSDEPGLPASLSQKAIQTRLREEVGFKGVVISDDLEAPAVASRFPLEESVVQAIKAGNDMLLIGNQSQPSQDIPERFATIVRQAVMTGTITRERLQASYDRIIAAKQSLSQAAREIASRP